MYKKQGEIRANYEFNKRKAYVKKQDVYTAELKVLKFRQLAFSPEEESFVSLPPIRIQRASACDSCLLGAEVITSEAAHTKYRKGTW